MGRVVLVWVVVGLGVVWGQDAWCKPLMQQYHEYPEVSQYTLYLTEITVAPCLVVVFPENYDTPLDPSKRMSLYLKVTANAMLEQGYALQNTFEPSAEEAPFAFKPTIMSLGRENSTLLVMLFGITDRIKGVANPAIAFYEF